MEPFLQKLKPIESSYTQLVTYLSNLSTSSKKKILEDFQKAHSHLIFAQELIDKLEKLGIEKRVKEILELENNQFRHFFDELKRLEYLLSINEK